jgi:hypothetical protein
LTIRLAFLIALLIPFSISAQPPGSVLVRAGGGDQEGENIPVLDVGLNFPIAAIAASDGTLYIADTANHRIRVVDPATGLIRTLAGTGVSGDSGDGGPAAEADLRSPQGIALDEDADVLYVADTGNHVIRAIDLFDGTISTVAGTRDAGFSGDDGPAILGRWEQPCPADRSGYRHSANSRRQRLSHLLRRQRPGH